MVMIVTLFFGSLGSKSGHMVRKEAGIPVPSGRQWRSEISFRIKWSSGRIPSVDEVEVNGKVAE